MVPRLIAITDAAVRPWPELLDAADAALGAGLPAVMLRDLTLPDVELLPVARRLREATRHAGALLLVSRRIELARRIGADGIHLGLGARPPREVANELGLPLAGYSAHQSDEAAAAIAAGASYVFLSPVFATASKPGATPLGLEAFGAAARRHPGRIVALGGITLANAGDALAAGAAGVAAIRAVLGAADPAAATRALLAR